MCDPRAFMLARPTPSRPTPNGSGDFAGLPTRTRRHPTVRSRSASLHPALTIWPLLTTTRLENACYQLKLFISGNEEVSFGPGNVNHTRLNSFFKRIYLNASSLIRAVKQLVFAVNEVWSVSYRRYLAVNSLQHRLAAPGPVRTGQWRLSALW